MQGFQRIRRGLLLSAALAAAPLAAHAAWPDQPIRLIVPYAAGGGADNVARVIAGPLGEKLGQSIIIENRPGAGATIAEGVVARSAPDGYTVLYDTFTYAVNASLRKLNFNPSKDLTPVALTATAPLILVVNPKVPANNLAEFVTLAKDPNNKVTYASYGIGSAAHLAAELLAREAKLSMLHIPYKGGAPALVDLVGGQVNAYFANASSGLPYVRNGTLRALAVSSTKRLNTLPDVPTVAESGYPGFDVLEWHGVFVPTGTPPEVARKLADAIQAVISSPDVKQRLNGLGIDPSTIPPSGAKAYIDDQVTRWSTLIKDRNISLE
ncbi:tripartite tricarboxylate transporter substrate binding protein [Bordetella sp. N]|uniref:tripartite tricarboxylate transporter substrate binding protein n=1 Tax=Bordetella sp. N TaxID=1746199 RepID=UPI00070EB475|nr:tripartite tricarboxylate transporter substrate binding protein [Bordetella sp. N]ALM86173.1 LacI family transcriptional regulator [Bordetella sp. N]